MSAVVHKSYDAFLLYIFLSFFILTSRVLNVTHYEALVKPLPLIRRDIACTEANYLFKVATKTCLIKDIISFNIITSLPRNDITYHPLLQCNTSITILLPPSPPFGRCCRISERPSYIISKVLFLHHVLN